MKFFLADIQNVVDTEINEINTIIIENQQLFLTLVTDIQNQISGLEGRCVVSRGNKVLSFNKNVEMITQFVPFDLNQKTLLTKVCNAFEKKTATADYFIRSQEVLSAIELFLQELAFEFTGDIQFTKINMGSIIKASGLEFCNEYESLAEKILDYMELVNEYEQEKAFVLVNLRSYISDKEASALMESIVAHRYHVLMIENCEYPLLIWEKRLIIDADLCEIM